MDSMNTSYPSPKKSGNGTQHSEQDVAHPSMTIDEESFKILFVMYAKFLENLYSPDQVIMALTAGKAMAKSCGLNPDKVDRIAENTMEFWRKNRKFGDMF